MAILKRGLAGEPVKRLQAKLGVEADGEFGPKTEEALKAYQQQHGLAVDGIAGPDTFAQMGLHELVLLKVGTSGETVKKLQRSLALEPDGRFGPATEKAVKAFQETNGLTVDGMAGPETLSRMRLFTEMTEAVVEKSLVPASAVEDAAPAQAQTQGAPARRSIWDTLKSFFK